MDSGHRVALLIDTPTPDTIFRDLELMVRSVQQEGDPRGDVAGHCYGERRTGRARVSDAEAVAPQTAAMARSAIPSHSSLRGIGSSQRWSDLRTFCECDERTEKREATSGGQPLPAHEPTFAGVLQFPSPVLRAGLMEARAY